MFDDGCMLGSRIDRGLVDGWIDECLVDGCTFGG